MSLFKIELRTPEGGWFPFREFVRNNLVPANVEARVLVGDQPVMHDDVFTETPEVEAEDAPTAKPFPGNPGVGDMILEFRHGGHWYAYKNQLVPAGAEWRERVFDGKRWWVIRWSRGGAEAEDDGPTDGSYDQTNDLKETVIDLRGKLNRVRQHRDELRRENTKLRREVNIDDAPSADPLPANPFVGMRVRQVRIGGPWFTYKDQLVPVDAEWRTLIFDGKRWVDGSGATAKATFRPHDDYTAREAAAFRRICVNGLKVNVLALDDPGPAYPDAEAHLAIGRLTESEFVRDGYKKRVQLKNKEIDVLKRDRDDWRHEAKSHEGRLAEVIRQRDDMATQANARALECANLRDEAERFKCERDDWKRWTEEHENRLAELERDRDYWKDQSQTVFKTLRQERDDLQEQCKDLENALAAMRTGHKQQLKDRDLTIDTLNIHLTEVKRQVPEKQRHLRRRLSDTERELEKVKKERDSARQTRDIYARDIANLSSTINNLRAEQRQEEVLWRGLTACPVSGLITGSKIHLLDTSPGTRVKVVRDDV